jgi:quercetin dioxygenase-like cupin family protein
MQHAISSTWQRVITGVALIGALMAAIAGFTVSHERPVAATTFVASRAVLAQGLPEAAPGQVLQLVRYEIPFGVLLPMHTHPGLQVVWIESGVLTYNVVSGGSIPVTRDHGAAPATTELIGSGQVTELDPGDSVVEIEGVVHYAQNLGDEPVVFLAAALLDPSEPPSMTVTPTPVS